MQLNAHAIFKPLYAHSLSLSPEFCRLKPELIKISIWIEWIVEERK